jgi:uncharacterized protein YcbX
VVLVGRVGQLWRYPVKSVGGERCHELELDARGAAGDRGFALYGTDGKIGSGKTTRRFRRMDGLLHYSASLDDHVPVIVCPDGSRIRAGEPAADAALSAALGEPITVRREAGVRHFDDGPVHVLSSPSLRWLAARMGDADAPDVRRFRPNIVLEVEATAGCPEEEWLGRTLSIGASVHIDVVDRTQRCVMTTMSQRALDEDARVLRTLGQLNDGYFGVYASVRSPGRLRVGDTAHLLAEPA